MEIRNLVCESLIDMTEDDHHPTGHYSAEGLSYMMSIHTDLLLIKERDCHYSGQISETH